MPPNDKRQKGDKMGYSKGVRWDDDLIREKIFEVKSALGLERMPSRSECKEYFHDESLINAVSRRKKWYTLADELGLKVKDSETYFGKSQEAVATELLTSMGFSVRRMSSNFPYDLLVDDCVKVDVKASHLYHGPNGSFYTFNLEKDFATCDIYILFTLNGDNKETSAFVVPSKEVVAQNQISMGEKKSKYHRFKDRWDYISSLSEFWAEMT